MSNAPIVRVENLTFSYRETPVLENIQFEMEPLDYVAIIGPNGGGKSTLLKCMMGLIKPQKGSIQIFDQTPKVGRNKIGYLSQGNTFDLDFPMTVIELVLMGSLGQNPFKRYKEKDIQDAHAVMKRATVYELRDRSFAELSGGQKQRVLLARALMRNPKLLILDEPTTHIDMHTENCFYTLLNELNKEMAILLISHDISVVSKHVKKIACLNQTMVYHGTKELMPKDVEQTYCCHVDMIAHGVPHRVLKDHSHD